jgi:hypothetical protein
MKEDPDMLVRSRRVVIGMSVGLAASSIGLLIVKGTSALPLILGFGTGFALSAMFLIFSKQR